jgi:hypothetical protein
MNRPPLEVADLVRAAGKAFIERSRKWFTWQHLTVLNAITALPHRRLGRASGCVFDCGTSGHLLQQLPQPALPEVSSQRPRPLARSASSGAAPHALRPCGLHVAACNFRRSRLQNKREIYHPAIPGQCRNAPRSRSRSQTSRRGDRILQCPPHLESKTPASSARSLCGARRRSRSGPLHWIDRSSRFFLPVKVLSRSVSRQVCGRPAKQLPAEHKLGFHGNLKPFGIPKLSRRGFVRCSETPGTSTPNAPFGGAEHALSLSRPLHPSRRHLQPPTCLARRWPSHLPLARLRS